jgi:hypothetical protein
MESIRGLHRFRNTTIVRSEQLAKVTELRSDRLSYSEKLPSGRHITYRVRALGQQAPSAWSNPTWVDEMH